MAKSNYLFGILSLAVVFICGNLGGDFVSEGGGGGMGYEGLGLRYDEPKSISEQYPEGSKPMAQYLQSVTKKIYNSQIGVREQGINSGPEVEDYLRYVNLGRGQPWCAAFVCWVYGQAGVENPRSGWSPDLFKRTKVVWTRAESVKLKGKSEQGYRASGMGYEVSGRRLMGLQPRFGDVFGIYFPEKGRIAHAGFVDQWDDTWLITVEGNTNVSGSREGDGVYRKRRLVKSVYKVARYIGRLNSSDDSKSSDEFNTTMYITGRLNLVRVILGHAGTRAVAKGKVRNVLQQGVKRYDKIFDLLKIRVSAKGFACIRN